MPLLLSRKIGQTIVITTTQGPVRVTVVGWDRGQAKLAVNAPREIPVHREELTVVPFPFVTSVPPVPAPL